tara:strand:+ start:1515 stop:2735 length:1221 start_codon:yes stop_codon:yes gene_type:complete
MELKRFVAADSKAAMQQVRANYGDDALVVSTQKVGSKTEMICAVNLLPENNAEQAPVKQLDTAKETAEGTGFVSQLGAALQETKPASTPEMPVALYDKKAEVPVEVRPTQELPAQTPHTMQELMHTIQAEIADLRSSLEEQIAQNAMFQGNAMAGPWRTGTSSAAADIYAQPPALHADTALQGKVLSLTQQLSDLRQTPLAKQCDWNGIHVFFGQPGSGKTEAIYRILKASKTTIAKPFALVALETCEDTTDSVSRPNKTWLELSSIGQSARTPCYSAVGLAEFKEVLAQLENSHTVLVDTQAECLTHYSEIAELAESIPLEKHLCIAADSSHLTLENYPRGHTSDGASALGSVVLTRADLCRHLAPMIHAMACHNAELNSVMVKPAAKVANPAIAEEKNPAITDD